MQPPFIDSEVVQAQSALMMAMMALHRKGGGIYTFRLWRTEYLVTVESGMMTVKEKKVSKIPHFFFMLALLLSATVAFAEPNATVLRVVDGDTLWVDAVCVVVGHNRTECGQVPVRIRGIDTAELHNKCPAGLRLALAAKKAAEGLLAPGDKITLSDIGLEKYGRLLATVQNKDGVDVGGELLKRGLAHTYSGGTKQPWCP